MYAVNLINGSKSVAIHDPFEGGNKLLSAVIKFEINKVAQFDFQFLPNNNGYKSVIKPLQTMVQVINVKTGREVFYGRIIPITNDMAETGVFTFAYNAKSELDFLNDSKQRQQLFSGTKAEYFKMLLDFHNQNLENYKEFQVGNIADLIEHNEKVEIDVDPTKTTFALITDTILNEYGLEMEIRKEDGIKYLDLKKKIGIDSQTAIKLSVNLLALKQHINPQGIVSRLLVYGKQNNETKKRLTIASVNGGKEYLDRPDLIDEYGIRMETVTYNDIEDVNELLRLGKEIIATQKSVSYQYSVSAVNLSHINPNFDEFVEGNTYAVVNPVMEINERLRVVSRQIDLINVERSNMNIGEKFKSAEEWQVENLRLKTKQLATINQLKDAKDNISNVETTIKNVTETINNVNTAIENQQSQLLSPQDKAKLDKILVTKTINLDELVKRIENLERE